MAEHGKTRHEQQSPSVARPPRFKRRPVLEAAFLHRSRVNRGYLVDVSVGMVICLDAHLPPENDRDTVTYALEDKPQNARDPLIP